ERAPFLTRRALKMLRRFFQDFDDFSPDSCIQSRRRRNGLTHRICRGDRHMASMPQSTKLRGPGERTTEKRRKPEKGARRPKLSRLHKPEDMSLETWQVELRRQFGREQDFQLKNLGEHPVFSEFEVCNPQSGSSYRVAIRGTQLGDNFCACPDFAINTLGTCKHIEFALATLERKRGGREALEAGFQPPFSEVFLHYGARREPRFRPGTDCPPELARLTAKYFGPEGTL